MLSQETEGFAKNCAKKGGYFKCCVTMFTLNIFEKARNWLIQEKLRFYLSHLKIFIITKSDHCLAMSVTPSLRTFS